MLTIKFIDSALSGGSKSISYTVQAGDTLTTIATGIKTAINADSALSTAGITSTSAGTVVTIRSTSPNATTYSQSVNTGATETITLSVNQNANITAKMLHGLLEVQNEFDISVLISSSSPFEQEISILIQHFKFDARILRSHSNMAGLLSTCDLVIGAGGSSSWERCCLGVPALQIILADNQKDVTENLARVGAIQSIGLPREFSPEIITKAVDSLLANSRTLTLMRKAALNVCDGLGSKRIADCAESIRS